MTPDEALSILAHMSRRAMATADDHAFADQAVQVLTPIVTAYKERQDPDVPADKA